MFGKDKKRTDGRGFKKYTDQGVDDKYGAGDKNQWKLNKFTEGKSCDTCIHNDRCPYDHNPGKTYICWKRDPRAKSN